LNAKRHLQKGSTVLRKKVFGKKRKFSILKQGDARLEQISFKAHNLP